MSIIRRFHYMLWQLPYSGAMGPEVVRNKEIARNLAIPMSYDLKITGIPACTFRGMQFTQTQRTYWLTPYICWLSAGSIRANLNYI